MAANMADSYNTHAQCQHALIQTVKPLLEEAMTELFSEENFKAKPLRVGEFGCAMGGNSILPLQVIADQAFSAGCSSMSVLLGDLPSSEWRTTASTVTPEALGAHLPVYVHMCGRSHFEQITPDASLDVSYSFTSVNWLSENLTARLGAMPHCFHPTSARDNPEQRAIWLKLAAKDWATFVENRGKEMGIGGKMIISVCARVRGECSWYQANRALYDSVRELVPEYLSDRELADFVLPEHCRDKSEVEDPFLSDSCPFRLDKLAFSSTPCVHRELLRQGAITLEEFGAGVMDTILAYMTPMFVSCLHHGGASRGEAILSKARENAEALVRSDPDFYQLDQEQWTVVATRVAGSCMN
mmetsp:Transcript_29136/g.53164  ORF Transcript_29136/g.53164 Transcript_29136/m.53164 type:complete len:356 (+) Transcript_29136:50-1117(+)